MPGVEHIRLAYNNIYLVEDGGERVLVDTGPDYRGAWESIMSALGGRLPDRVIATHGHHDHAGMGKRWQEAGVPVWLGAADQHYTDGDMAAFDAEYDLISDFVGAIGAPAPVVTEARQTVERRRRSAHEARRGYPLPAGRARWPTGLQYRDFHPDHLITAEEDAGAGLRVIPAAGHTPGNLVLLHEAEGWLFAGDQLLPHITATPSIQSGGAGARESGDDWRFHTLPAFCDSHERLAHHDLSRCFPGHGDPWDDPSGRIAIDLATIRERSQETLGVVEAQGEPSLFAVAEALYPRAASRHFWQIVPAVLGQLDLLEDAGTITRRQHRYQPA